MRNVLDNDCRMNQNTYFVLRNFFLILPFVRYVEKYCRAGQQAQMAIRRVRVSRWIPKFTDTHSEYVILIPYPLQQWLHERA
jgi:hypothetical protein